ncbi:hypothetical protein [Streptomyces sp. RFCAC02]|uniref:hypothetical protein n=1 Tax=Streptomyces sp. RFCAC02 TaxID=2499143 RepID=UPI0019D06BFB|nr:hypothetical protein [Streptomyces sp. RFCAC02]
MTDTPAQPEIGTMVYDASHDRIGRVMSYLSGHIWLRPPGGGREWTALPDEVRPISASESLRHRVAEANRRARQQRHALS